MKILFMSDLFCIYVATIAVASRHFVISSYYYLPPDHSKVLFYSQRISLTTHSLALCFSAPLHVKISSVSAAILDKLQ